MNFFLIYIREAHSVDGWQVDANASDDILFKDHKDSEGREQTASACQSGLKLSIPILIDTMDNATDRLFGAWPERIYVLSREGIVAYQGGKGPYGFDPEALHCFLRDSVDRPELHRPK